MKENKRRYPFALLAVWLWAVASYALHPAGALWRFNASDADDFLRLVRVRDWMDGASWFDNSIPGMAYANIPWSRLIDLPLAALTLFLAPLGGREAALTWAARIWPLVLLGAGLLPLLWFAARLFVPRRRAVLAGVLTLFMPALLFEFAPGRVDHHGVQLLVALGAFSCWGRAVLTPRLRFGLGAGLCLAAGLAVGGEVAPHLMTLSVLFLALGAAQGGRWLRVQAAFGGSLASGTLALFLLLRPPSLWGERALGWFSLLYVVAALLIGLLCILAAWMGEKTSLKAVRFLITALLGLAAAWGFYLVAPELAQGPYAGFSRVDADLILAHVSEAAPLWPVSFSWARAPLLIAWFLHNLALPCLGLSVAFWRSAASRGRRRFLWLGLSLMFAVCLGLALFWQKRLLPASQMFALVPLAWLAAALGRAFKGRRLAQGIVLLALGPLPVVLLPGLFAGQKLGDMALFAAPLPAKACRYDGAAAAIKALSGTHVILAPLDAGPELLYRTHQAVLAGPYEVPTNGETMRFWRSRDAGAARFIMEQLQADLIVLCRSIPPHYAGLERGAAGRAALVLKNGRLIAQSDPENPTMIERLLAGNPPPWLKKLDRMDGEGVLLYQRTD